MMIILLRPDLPGPLLHPCPSWSIAAIIVRVRQILQKNCKICKTGFFRFVFLTPPRTATMFIYGDEWVLLQILAPINCMLELQLC